MVGFLLGLGAQLLRGLTDDGSGERYYIWVSEVFLELNSEVSDRHSQHPTKTVSFSAIVNPQIVFTRTLTRLFQSSDFIIYSCRDIIN